MDVARLLDFMTASNDVYAAMDMSQKPSPPGLFKIGKSVYLLFLISSRRLRFAAKHEPSSSSNSQPGTPAMSDRRAVSANCLRQCFLLLKESGSGTSLRDMWYWFYRDSLRSRRMCSMFGFLPTNSCSKQRLFLYKRRQLYSSKRYVFLFLQLLYFLNNFRTENSQTKERKSLFLARPRKCTSKFTSSWFVISNLQVWSLNWKCVSSKQKRLNNFRWIRWSKVQSVSISEMHHIRNGQKLWVVWSFRPAQQWLCYFSCSTPSRCNWKVFGRSETRTESRWLWTTTSKNINDQWTKHISRSTIECYSAIEDVQSSKYKSGATYSMFQSCMWTEISTSWANLSSKLSDRTTTIILCWMPWWLVSKTIRNRKCKLILFVLLAWICIYLAVSLRAHRFLELYVSFMENRAKIGSWFHESQSILRSSPHRRKIKSLSKLCDNETICWRAISHLAPWWSRETVVCDAQQYIYRFQWSSQIFR